MTATERNLLAGLSNSIWSALVGLLAIPFYLKYLGTEAYGLIGFYVMTGQILFQLFDMGMALTINREIARYSVTGDIEKAGKLLHTLAIIYWVISVLIAVSISSLAPFIAGYWLHPGKIPPESIFNAIILIGGSLALRWPLSLYQGALIGAQHLVISSTINIILITLNAGGAILVLAFISPSIEAFFIWQACTNFVLVCVMRKAAWKVIGSVQRKIFDMKALKSVLHFSIGAGSVNLTSFIYTQLDKIIISKFLSLEAFGYYMLATTVVGSLSALISPVFNVIYPKLSYLAEMNKEDKLVRFYRFGTRMFGAMLFPVSVMLCLFSKDFLTVWIGEVSSVAQIAPIVSLLAIGSALNGIMNFPYALQLAHGMTFLPLGINLTLLVFHIPAVFYFVHQYGAAGAAMAWVGVEIIYVLLGSWLTHRFLLKGLVCKWLSQDVCLPAMLSLLIGGIGLYVSERLPSSGKIVVACCLIIISTTFIVLTLQNLRDSIFKLLSNVRIGAK